MVETKVVESDIPFVVTQEGATRIRVKLSNGKEYEFRGALCVFRVDAIEPIGDSPIRIQSQIQFLWTRAEEVTHGT